MKRGVNSAGFLGSTSLSTRPTNLPNSTAHTPLERSLSGPYGKKLRQKPEGTVYLYLGKTEWADAWINAGEIPMSPAKDYLGPREGTSTPDEVKQKRSEGARIQDLSPAIQVSPNPQIQNLQFTGCSINGEMIPDTRIDDYNEQSVILCFSTRKCKNLMRKLKKECCVEIVNFESLLSSIEQQYDEVNYGPVLYTEGDERSHFMKSSEDQYMAEFRISVPRQNEKVWIKLQSGVAQLCELSDQYG